MEHKKYRKIYRAGHPDLVGAFIAGDIITVTEKLDGSNASFWADPTTRTVRCGSRNLELVDGGLNGFWLWVQNNVEYDKLEEGYIYFGEWLCPHKITYPKEKLYNFYMFSVYDSATSTYLGQEEVEKSASRIGTEIAPVFYYGEYTNFDDIMEYAGKSAFAEFGEGVVVKNESRESMYMKIVTEKFAEVKGKKKERPASDGSRELAEMLITPARVEKELYKMLDEGLAARPLTLEKMGNLLKVLPNRVVEDCMEEEAAMFEGVEPKRFIKEATRLVAFNLKNIILEMEYKC